MEEFVKLQDITKIYKMGEVEIRAADKISFSINKGVGRSFQILLDKFDGVKF